MIDFVAIQLYIQSLLAFFFSINFGFNGLDILIVLVFAFYAFESLEVGFLSAVLDLISFVISFVTALLLYVYVGILIVQLIAIPKGFGNAIGFFLIAFIIEIFLNISTRKLFNWLTTHVSVKESTTGQKVQLFLAYIKGFNNWFGLLPGFISAYILLSFLLTTIMGLPFSPYLKHTVSNSKLGNLLVANTQTLETRVDDIFGGVLKETLNFLTVSPQSDEFVRLNFHTNSYATDEVAEAHMLTLLNKERTIRGLSPVRHEDKLRSVAREHAADMLTRGYFSHYTPERLSPFDRMAKANITYKFAGENLALAPNVELAMQGFMNSPGHKASILSPNFRKVGIGAQDAGIYGIMFSQEFSD